MVWGLTVVFIGPWGEGGRKPFLWALGCIACPPAAAFARGHRSFSMWKLQAAEDAGQAFVTALEHEDKVLALRLNWVTCSAGAGEHPA